MPARCRRSRPPSLPSPEGMSTYTSRSSVLFSPLPLRERGWGRGGSLGAQTCSPPLPDPLPQGSKTSAALLLLLPLPLAGEGRGEGRKSGRRTQSPPHPYPLHQGGEGVEARVKQAFCATKKMCNYPGPEREGVKKYDENTALALVNKGQTAINTIVKITGAAAPPLAAKLTQAQCHARHTTRAGAPRWQRSHSHTRPESDPGAPENP